MATLSMDFLRLILSHKEVLASSAHYYLPSDPYVEKIFKGPNRVFVAFLNLNAGFGVIQTISGDVYFDSEHNLRVKTSFLKKGAEVAFRNLIPSDKDGTFKKKAIGVRVIG